MLTGLLWVEIFFMFMFAMIIAVPRSKILHFLPLGIFGGFSQSFLLLGYFVPVIGWWKFNHANVFSLAGIPLFIALAWTPVVIIYAYYFNRLKHPLEVLAYQIAFSLVTGLYVHWLVRAGFLVFLNWHSILTVIIAFLLYSPITYYMMKIYHLRYTKEI